MSAERALPEHIDLVERRIDLRRRALKRQIQDLRDEVKRGRKWIAPAVAIGGLGLVGFLLARSGSKRRTARTIPGARNSAGLVATLLAVGGAALRFAISPQGRALWHAVRSRSGGYDDDDPRNRGGRRAARW